MSTFTTNDLSDLRTLMARRAAAPPDPPKPPSRARRPRRPRGAPRNRQLARLKARLTEIVKLAKKVQDASRRITAAQRAKEFFGDFELTQLAGEVDSWSRRICSLLEFDGPDIRAALDRIPPPPMPDTTDTKGAAND